MSPPFDGLPPLPGGDENPYLAPTAAGRPEGGTAGDATGPGLVRHVMPVAILMLVQGGLELLVTLLYLAAFVAVPFLFPVGGPAAQPAAGPNPGAMRPIMMTVLGVMAAGGLVAGLLHISAGIFGLRFRRRTFGVVALSVGMASITTIYCLPTSIGLAIYGLITYLNPAVAAAFRLGDAGMPAAEIRARFGG
ncbi:MAG: hypothetical protein ACKPBV_21295 [Sphaerospermopsis kisseleviana]